MDLGISGKRALVLGASRGLGGAIAAALAAEGVEVLGASRSSTFPVDLADPRSVAALAEAVLARGGVDILVNNTGGPKAGPAKGESAANWTAAFEAMAASLFSLTDALLPAMIERRWGRIITVGSSGVVQPIPASRSRTACAARSPAGRRRWRAKWRNTASPSTWCCPVASRPTACASSTR